MKTLTGRQREILDFVSKSVNSFGFPPTIPEIQKEFSFKSPTAASDHLEALARKGYIKRHPGKSRGIEISGQGYQPRQKNRYLSDRKANYEYTDRRPKTYYLDRPADNANVVPVPVIGRIAAGMPILAQENIEDTIFLDSSFIKVANGRMHGIFALRIKGDSMKDAGIFDGDLVIIEQQTQVNNGEIAAVLIDDEATLKRVFKEKGKLRLQPENDTMDPIIIDSDKSNISVMGKLKTVIRNI